MSDRSFESSNPDFTTDTDLLRGANVLPTLSSRLRARVLDAATAAYRHARRCAEARQAASFLSACLLVSCALSPIASLSLTDPIFEHFARVSAASADLASTDQLIAPPQPYSAWTLRHDRAILEAPRRIVDPIPVRQPLEVQPQRTVDAPPSDSLLATLNRSEGWGTVQAFQAVRFRSQNKLQRAFAAN